MNSLIMTLPVIIGVAGLTLVFVFFSLIRQASNSSALKQHRSSAEGLSDLLVHSAIVEDGIIVCKSGALMASWEYSGKDLDDKTPLERDNVSDVINRTLKDLGSGWMLHVDSCRSSLPAYFDIEQSHFPDKVSFAIDTERRRFFERKGQTYASRYVMTLTYFPPILAEAKFTELMFDDNGRKKTDDEMYQSILDNFRQKLNTVESGLSSVLHLRRLKSFKVDGVTFDELLSHLNFCVTGTRQKIALPSTPMYIDNLIGSQELWTGTIPRIGKKYIQTVAIEGFPSGSHANILGMLSALGLEYRWSTRFIFLHQTTAISHLNAFRRKWHQQQRGIIDQILRLNGRLNMDAVNMTEDADAAITEVQDGLVSAGYYTSVIVIMDEDRERLSGNALAVSKSIQDLGFATRIETINTMDAWLGSIPGHGVENVRRPLINTLNLADLLPVSSPWLGNPNAPCPMYPSGSPALMKCVTGDGTPFNFNLHHRDLGHAVVFGPTGAGKSTALAIIMAQALRYKNMTVFCFDKGLSMYPLTKACGGQHYIVGMPDQLQFSPMQYLSTPDDIAWAQDWIVTIMKLKGATPTPRQEAAINAALKSMSESGMHTLTEFVTSVQDETIRDTINLYTMSGAMGSMLDSQNDGLDLSKSHFVTFETEEIMSRNDEWVIPTMLYLFRRIEKSLHGQPALIVLDEAWRLLENDLFREKIKEWLKVLRKLNCALIMATQSLSDVSNSSIADVIRESTATKICLANYAARTKESRQAYYNLGLNDAQIGIVADASPKRDYYIIQESGSRVFSFSLGKLALSFVGVSDRDSVLKIYELERQYGNDWVNAWLKERDLKLNDYLDGYEATK